VAGIAPPVRRNRRWQALTGAKRFEAALRQRPCARSEHFAVHRVLSEPVVDELSTTPGDTAAGVVDDLDRVLLVGMVVPKRHAKRAVTRNLIKRQIRAAIQRHVDTLPLAIWIVRLRAPIDRKQFPSAGSEALARAMRDEIEPLIGGLAALKR
jgi:ribonuclease P protein component